jgi:WD40 repeat protein
LTRRGLALGVPLLAASLPQGAASAALPASLVEATARAAVLVLSGQAVAAGVSAQVAALAEGGVKAVVGTRLRAAGALLLALGVLAAGAGLAGYRARDAKDGPKTHPVAGTEPRRAQLSARADQYGDPLPSQAVARVGTVRWWHGWEVGDKSSLAFAPDGKSLVSCDSHKAVLLLDAATGKELRRIVPPGEEVRHFAFSADGNTMVTGSWSSPVLRLWDIRTARDLRKVRGDKRGTSAVAFSPDGKTFAAATGDWTAATGDGVVRLWDVATWRATGELRGHAGVVRSIVFLPDGKTLLSGGGTCQSIRWWDLRTRREVRRLPFRGRRRDQRSRLAASPDGKRLAAVGPTGEVHLWDAATGAEVSRVALYDRGSGILCFSPDSQTLACGNCPFRRGIQTRFLAAATGRELYRHDEESYTITLAFSPDGKLLAQTSNGFVRLQDARTGKPARPALGLRDLVGAVRFTRDGKSLVTGWWGGRTGFWDPLTGKASAPFQDPPKGFAGRADRANIALSADGRKAALVDARGVLHVWEPATGKVCCRIGDPPAGEFQAGFSPDGRAVVAKHRDDLLRVCDAATGERRCSLARFTGYLFSVPHAFSPHGRVLATAPPSEKETVIRLWDTRTGKEVGRLGHEDETAPTALHFSPEGKYLVAAHTTHQELTRGWPGERTVRVWDLAARRELWRCPSPARLIEALAFSPDGKTLAAGAVDTVLLWELASGKERGRLAGHGAFIRSLAFSPDGRLLASGSSDYTALVWDVTGVCPDGKWSHRALGPGEGERLWADLAGADGTRAYRALWALAAGGDASARFLAGRVRPVARVEGRRLARLIAGLDSDEFAARGRASEELERLGELAGAALHKALAARPGPEARRRLERLVKKLGGPVASPDALRPLRAVEALEKVGTPEARRVLAALAGGAPEARLAREANAALERLAGGVRSSGTTAAPARR